RFRNVRLTPASALAATAMLLAAGSSSSASTPADQQLAWIVALINNATKAPSTAVLEQHFAPSFLKAVPPGQLIDGLTSIDSARPLRVGAVLSRKDPETLQARVDGRGTSFTVTIHVTADKAHRIDGLQFTPVAVKLSTWSAVDARLRKLA